MQNGKVFKNLENLQNIYYIKENGNYYVLLIFTNEEKYIPLKEGRLLIEKLNNDQTLRKKLLKKGFYGFYRIVNDQYQEISFTEYQAPDKPNPYEVIKDRNLPLSQRVAAAEEIKTLQTSKVTIRDSIRPRLRNIEKIYLYEPEKQYIIYYKNGMKEIVTKEELIQLTSNYLIFNNLKSLKQLYDMAIIEDITEEKMDSLFKKYSLKDSEERIDIEKIILYKDKNEDKESTKAIVFYKNGKTKVINRSEAEREILNLKKSNNISSPEQLFAENRIECVEKFNLYRNFENYRNQVLEKNNILLQEDDPFEVMPVDDFYNLKSQGYRKLDKEQQKFKDKIKNIIQKLENKFDKQLKTMKLASFFSIGLGVSFLNIAVHSVTLVHKVIASEKQIEFCNADDKNLEIFIGNQAPLQTKSSLDALEKELIKAKKKRREQNELHQAILKKDTIPQEELKMSSVPAERIIIEEQLKEENQTMHKEVQVEENNVTSIAEVPENNNQTEAINYIAIYNITPKQLDIIKATIQHEAGWNEEEVEAVTSTVINRCVSGIWGGSDPWSVITAPTQFSSYGYGYYKQYLNGNYADYTDTIVNEMLSGESGPIHGYERFSSGGSGEQFTPGGNHYR